VASEKLIDRRRRMAVAVGDLVIESTERILVRVDRVGSAIVGLAQKRPISVVVRSPTGVFRFDLEALGLTGEVDPTIEECR
jgi:hypothetical protein